MEERKNYGTAISIAMTITAILAGAAVVLLGLAIRAAEPTSVAWYLGTSAGTTILAVMEGVNTIRMIVTLIASLIIRNLRG